MSRLVVAAIALIACSKKVGAPAAGSGSGSAPAGRAVAETVSCEEAAREYTNKMAATPGNVLSDAKPDSGLLRHTRVSMEDYCIGEGSMVIAWTAAEKACVRTAASSATAVSACFVGPALSQVNAGLHEVVTTALANRKANAAREAAGSAKPE